MTWLKAEAGFPVQHSVPVAALIRLFLAIRDIAIILFRSSVRPSVFPLKYLELLTITATRVSANARDLEKI